MNVNRITIKFFIENAAAYNITDIIPIFHQWIREDRLPGLLIDVADYKHVPEGPGIILIGHEVDYALDEGHGRLGLLVRRKRIEGGSLREHLQQTTAWAIQAGRRLQQDAGVTVHTGEVEISFPDRLNVPNTAGTFVDIQAEVTAVLQSAFGTNELELKSVAVDGQRPLTIKATIPNASALPELNQAAIAL